MHMAIYIWVITEFLDVPRKPLIFRFCLIHLENSSICLRAL